MGHGAGHLGVSPTTFSSCGTTLKFTGTSADAYAAIHLSAARFVTVSDFCIDGSAVLENGIVIDGDIHSGSLLSAGNVIERINIVDVVGSGVLLTGVGADMNDQVDNNLISRVRINRGQPSVGVYMFPEYCVKQTGGSRLTDNIVEMLNCAGATEDGVLNDGGEMHIRDSFIGDVKSGTGAGVRMKGSFNLGSVEGTAFEIDSGNGIVTEGGVGSTPIMKITNNRIDLGENGVDALDYNHKGTLILMGNRVGTRGGDASTRAWRITPSGSSLWLTEGENNIGTSLIERVDSKIRSSKGAGLLTNNCTSKVGMSQGDLCWDTDDEKLYVCNASDGECDSAGEWAAVN
jgi:hypothetical protein